MSQSVIPRKLCFLLLSGQNSSSRQVIHLDWCLAVGMTPCHPQLQPQTPTPDFMDRWHLDSGSGKVRRRFGESSGKVQERFREDQGKIKGRSREGWGKIRGGFRKGSGSNVPNKNFSIPTLVRMKPCLTFLSFLSSCHSKKSQEKCFPLTTFFLLQITGWSTQKKLFKQLLQVIFLAPRGAQAQGVTLSQCQCNVCLFVRLVQSIQSSIFLADFNQ